jgi:tetratricopeptide (TPR) repeat protein
MKDPMGSPASTPPATTDGPSPLPSVDPCKSPSTNAPAKAPSRKAFWIGILAVFVVALVLRVRSYEDVKQCALFDHKYPLTDSRYYDYRARLIAGGDLWGHDVYFMAPLYEYFLAVPYALSGQGVDASTPFSEMSPSDPDPAIYLQCILGACSCCLFFALGQHLFGSIGGWAAGLTAGSYGPFIFFDGLLMAPCLVLLVFLIMTWILIKADETDRRPWWFGGGAGIGLAAIAHGTALLIAPVLAGVLLYQLRRRPVSEVFSRMAAYGLGLFLIIALVTVRNFVVGRDLVLLTSNGGMNLFIGNNPTATGSHVTYKYPFRLAALNFTTPRTEEDPLPSEVSQALAGMARRWAASNPGAAFFLMLKKAMLFFNHVELSEYDNYHFFRQFSGVLNKPIPSFGWVAPLGLTGAICLIRQFPRLKIVYFLLLSQAGALILMFILARLRFPAVACLILLAAGQITWWIKAIHNRQFKKLGGSVVLLCIFGFVVHYPLDQFSPQRGMGILYARLGLAHEQNDHLDEALIAYGKAIDMPWHDRSEMAMRYRVLIRLGDLYAEHKELEKAIELWQTAKWEIETAHLEPILDPPSPYPQPLQFRPEVIQNIADIAAGKLQMAYLQRSKKWN